MTTEAYPIMTTAVAWCEDCGWRCEGEPAHGTAARHARHHGHLVRVESCSTIYYGEYDRIPDHPPGYQNALSLAQAYGYGGTVDHWDESGYPEWPYGARQYKIARCALHGERDEECYVGCGAPVEQVTVVELLSAGESWQWHMGPWEAKALGSKLCELVLAKRRAGNIGNDEMPVGAAFLDGTRRNISHADLRGMAEALGDDAVYAELARLSGIPPAQASQRPGWELPEGGKRTP